MCRIIAIPPNTTKKAALEIIADMYGDNEHGTGEVYLSEGKFVLNKYGQSFSKVVKKGKVFLNHLPHNGWTLAHIRKVSVGAQCKENAHPFISLDGQMALAHNGTLPQTDLLSLYLQTINGFVSNTDSAASCELISRIGVKDFTEFVNWGGVFAVLNLDGSLEISKISGELALHLRDDKTCLIASEFDADKYKNIELLRGYFKFNANGTYSKHKAKEFVWNGYPKNTASVYQGGFNHIYTGASHAVGNEHRSEMWY